MNKIIKNSVSIDSENVIKKRNNKVLELYDYFDEIGFDNYPKIKEVNEETIKMEYINSKKYYEQSDGIELIKTVALLHYKTLRNKSVSKDKYRTIYDRLYSNIMYLKEYYEQMISSIELAEFMSPSEYYFARNYSIINASLDYSYETLKKWFKMVENNSKERVCIVHNNICFNHYIRGDKNYLISFDDYLVDTPILDLYMFYKVDGYKLDFILLLEKYNELFTLNEVEKMLFNILISIPPKIEMLNKETDNCIHLKGMFNYIYSSMNVVNENK